MIRAVQTSHDAQEFAARVHGQLYFRSAMGMRLELFWQKPGSGWRFCLTEGGALMLRGDSAQLCGGCRDKVEAEELSAFAVCGHCSAGQEKGTSHGKRPCAVRLSACQKGRTCRVSDPRQMVLHCKTRRPQV